MRPKFLPHIRRCLLLSSKGQESEDTYLFQHDAIVVLLHQNIKSILQAKSYLLKEVYIFILTKWYTILTLKLLNIDIVSSICAWPCIVNESIIFTCWEMAPIPHSPLGLCNYSRRPTCFYTGLSWILIICSNVGHYQNLACFVIFFLHLTENIARAIFRL